MRVLLKGGTWNCQSEDLRPPVIHYCPFQGGSFVVVLCYMFWCQSFGDVSPYVCSYYF